MFAFFNDQKAIFFNTDLRTCLSLESLDLGAFF